MIKYKKGFKYQLTEDLHFKTDIIGWDIETEYIILRPDGYLIIKKGYAWDGASGPTIDTKNSMEGSCVHDAIYQLMRMGLLPQGVRPAADNLLEKICIAKGMWKFRAKMWCSMVRIFASSAASPKSLKKIYTIP